MIKKRSFCWLLMLREIINLLSDTKKARHDGRAFEKVELLDCRPLTQLGI